MEKVRSKKKNKRGLTWARHCTVYILDGEYEYNVRIRKLYFPMNSVLLSVGSSKIAENKTRYARTPLSRFTIEMSNLFVQTRLN